MNKKTKRKLKQRFYAYIFDMKKGGELEVAIRIIQDVEIYVMDLNRYQEKLEKMIKRLRNEK